MLVMVLQLAARFSMGLTSTAHVKSQYSNVVKYVNNVRRVYWGTQDNCNCCGCGVVGGCLFGVEVGEARRHHDESTSEPNNSKKKALPRSEPEVKTV